MTVKSSRGRTEREIRSEIAQTRREMKEQGIRKISCFNGGLSPAEYRYNSALFRLNVELDDVRKKQAKANQAEESRRIQELGVEIAARGEAHPGAGEYYALLRDEE